MKKDQLNKHSRTDYINTSLKSIVNDAESVYTVFTWFKYCLNIVSIFFCVVVIWCSGRRRSRRDCEREREPAKEEGVGRHLH